VYLRGAKYCFYDIFEIAKEHNLNESPASTSPPLVVENATKKFRQGEVTIEALKGVSLTINSGEFVAVMGASGSGKSTLLHVMAGLTKLDQGRILVDGQDLAAMSDSRLTHFRRRHIGLVFQAFNLISILTTEDNILLPLLAAGRNDSGNRQLDMLLARLDLAQHRRHLPDVLSGGEQQRVAIARALATKPSIILADEPTGSLDSVSGQNICRLLQELCQEQKNTIVVVTHEPAVAIWAERIVVLKDGRVIADFKTANIPDLHSLAAYYQDIVLAAAKAEA
jgi:putative ABC transport system ATP-binding protein